MGGEGDEDRREAAAEAQRPAGRGEAEASAAAPGRDGRAERGTGRLPGLSLMAAPLLSPTLLPLLLLLGLVRSGELAASPLSQRGAPPRRRCRGTLGLYERVRGMDPECGLIR